MTSLPSSPQPRPTVQRARCMPRSTTGLVPSSFKKAIEDAASPDKWTKLPPKPLPEMYPYRGDRVVALRNARNLNKVPLKLNAKLKATTTTAAKNTTNDNDYARKDATAKKNKEKWDSHLQGDKCMYQFSNQEFAKRLEIREQYTVFLNQLAKEREEREERNNGQEGTSTTLAKLGRAQQARFPHLKKHEFLRRQQRSTNKNGRCNEDEKKKTRQKDMDTFSKNKQSPPKATTISCASSRLCDDDKTIRSAVTAAIDDNESVKAAKAALDKVRRRLKLGKPITMKGTTGTSHVRTHVKTGVTNDDSTYSSYCENQSVISVVTKAIHEDDSVIEARVALEEARLRLGHLGFLSGNGKPLFSHSDKSEFLGDRSTVAYSRSDPTKSSWEYGLPNDSKNEPVLPAMVTFGSYSSIASTCELQSTDIGSVSSPVRHYCDLGETIASSLENCSRPCFESSFDQETSAGAVANKNLPSKKGMRCFGLDPWSRNQNDTDKYDCITSAKSMTFLEDVGTASHIMELRSAASPTMSLNDDDSANVYDGNAIWNPLVSVDRGDCSFNEDDNARWDRTFQIVPMPLDISDSQENTTSARPNIGTGRSNPYFTSHTSLVRGENILSRSRSSSGSTSCSILPSINSQSDRRCAASSTSVAAIRETLNISPMISVCNGSKDDWSCSSPSQRSGNLRSAVSSSPVAIRETKSMVLACNGFKEDWSSSPSQPSNLHSTTSSTSTAFIRDISRIIKVCNGSQEDWSLSV